MSISLVLIPAAFGAYSAWKASRPQINSDNPTVCQVQTRMRDEGLLAASLADTRAVVTQQQGTVVADWKGARAVFSRDVQGIWQVDLTGEVVDEATAIEIVKSVDEAYGRRVQAAVVTRLRERASNVGMRIESERVEDDQSVTLVLTAGAGTQ